MKICKWCPLFMYLLVTPDGYKIFFCEACDSALDKVRES